MKKTPRQHVANDHLRQRLHEALSDDELEALLPAALLALDAAGRQRLLDGLEAPTREALTLALSPPSKAASPVRAGQRKVEQEWLKLWARWDEIVAASGDENGRYVEQDHEWDTPYADRQSAADDLDAVAARFRALMPAVIAADLAPDLRFTEIVEDLDDELGAGLPDWISSPDGEDYHLGSETTRLFLEWDWAMESASGVSPKAFHDAWLEVEGRLVQVRLDAATVEGFRPARTALRRSRG
jgi:hypothetical protein